MLSVFVENVVCSFTEDVVVTDVVLITVEWIVMFRVIMKMLITQNCFFAVAKMTRSFSPEQELHLSWVDMWFKWF